MRIAVDAMGGDFAPRVVVEGALDAAQQQGVEILLIGPEKILKKEIERLDFRGANVTLVDAPETISMGEGLISLRRKNRSSIFIGAELVKKKEAEALVSMGNTAAVTYISKKVMGSLEGIEKPGLALLIPTLKGVSLLIDVGASANCTPEHLMQFAVMGKIFMEVALKRPNPTIALMSIGEEKTKGNELTLETYKRLEASPLNFIGNIEGKDIYSGAAEVIVSDGFTGNVALKVSEGVVETMLTMARREITRNLLAKLGFLLLKHHLKKIYKKIDYSEYGGAHLLGVNGICIIGHGRSNQKAVKNAIKMGKEVIAEHLQERIQEGWLRFARANKGVVA
ncbi:MAG: phosphate acyltransferase PlsX [Candidatus Saccharicenans sp.]|nr:MAG: phosphate acyltransferase PlsX [Candidatus Aminicenantes bacterium]HEK85532.1 phosphate acyltransferase PlsX [Candidatus Aminicenantes bacterium]